MTASEKEQLITLLNKCWMTHDGLWFYECLQELGVEKTNRINKAAIKALAEIEVNRVKKFLGVEGKRLDTLETFKDFLTSVSEFFIPDFMNASMSFPRENVLRWEFKPGECFAYKGMESMGVINDYECGVIYRVECWLDSLGVSYDIDPPVKKCLMIDGGRCSGDLILHF
ncbi:MAG: hypothetical protein JXI32_06465 [Deltaproteobacteria bacterium]|nr:hypothetical protein [Deltaproteobacteria bacterium]